MASKIEIKNLLENLKIVDESRISYYLNENGYNYVNDHSPQDINQAIKKVERFISFGGKVKTFADHIQVKWEAHSEGELVVYRIGESIYFAHGWIEVG